MSVICICAYECICGVCAGVYRAIGTKVCVAQVSTDTCICCIMCIWVSGHMEDSMWRDSRGSIKQGNASITFMFPRKPRGLCAQHEDHRSPSSERYTLQNHSENKCSVGLLGRTLFSLGQSGGVLQGAVADSEFSR